MTNDKVLNEVIAYSLREAFIAAYKHLGLRETLAVLSECVVEMREEFDRGN